MSRGFWDLSGGFSLEPLEGTATGLEPSHSAKGVSPLMGIGVPVRRGVIDRPDHAARIDNVLGGLAARGAVFFHVFHHTILEGLDEDTDNPKEKGSTNHVSKDDDDGRVSDVLHAIYQVRSEHGVRVLGVFIRGCKSLPDKGLWPLARRRGLPFWQ